MSYGSSPILEIQITLGKVVTEKPENKSEIFPSSFSPEMKSSELAKEDKEHVRGCETLLVPEQGSCGPHPGRIPGGSDGNGTLPNKYRYRGIREVCTLLLGRSQDL